MHRFTSDELLLAHAQLQERLAATLAVISNIARKTKTEHLPAGFRALVRAGAPAPTIHSKDGAFSLVWRIPGYTTQPLLLPAHLLRASDRDVATWARAEVNRCRPNAINRQRTALDREIADLEARHARLERDLSAKRAQRENLPRARRRGRPMGSRVKKDRRASGEVHVKPAKVPTGAYITKKDAKARRRRSAEAEARAFAAAAAVAPAMWQAMSAPRNAFPRAEVASPEQ